MLADIEKPKKYDHKPAFTERKLIQFASVPELILFNIKDFLHWWYIQMPMLFVNILGRIVQVLNDQLSITLLISNFFTAWRREDTIIGYFMGIIVKVLYLPIAIGILSFAIISVIFLTFLWLLIPLATIFFIIFTPILPI